MFLELAFARLRGCGGRVGDRVRLGRRGKWWREVVDVADDVRMEPGVVARALQEVMSGEAEV